MRERIEYIQKWLPGSHMNPPEFLSYEGSILGCLSGEAINSGSSKKSLGEGVQLSL